jgi:hypothetical protein
MKKLVRYHSFEALKGDIKPDNTKSTKSENRQVQMENFLKLLRRKWLEEKDLQKENLKMSNHHE